MEGERRLSLIVGLFVVAGLGVLAAVILSLSAERGFFQEHYRLIARFESVMGLQASAPVWLAGKQVGSVESVSFAELGESRPLVVVLRIDSEVQDLIREDSTATIGTIGVLGDAYVEVTVGSSASPPLRDGDEIRAVTPVGLSHLMTRAGTALENVASLTANLDAVVSRFAQGRGAEKAVDAIGAVSEMALAIRDGDGLLHSLIYDQYEGGGIESIERSLASLESILNEVRTGEGLLHSLIYEPVTEQDVIVEALEAGARLNSILAKIDRGEGTLGLLLNDPTLYEDLKILLGGAQRSSILRTLIRMATERGDAAEPRK